VDAFLVLIITLSGLLFLATAYMEWVGLLNVLTPRSGPRYPDCGHLRVNPTSAFHSCWRCRHRTLGHLLH
jgi:hypothetical protein